MRYSRNLPSWGESSSTCERVMQGFPNSFVTMNLSAAVAPGTSQSSPCQSPGERGNESLVEHALNSSFVTPCNSAAPTALVAISLEPTAFAAISGAFTSLSLIFAAVTALQHCRLDQWYRHIHYIERQLLSLLLLLAVLVEQKMSQLRRLPPAIPPSLDLSCSG